MATALGSLVPGQASSAHDWIDRGGRRLISVPSTAATLALYRHQHRTFFISVGGFC